ncbi:hypothetical protein RUM44_010310 [Polyplax serrata]|uniref:Uncharacterized protein n=1 Tax=Polyplax serrata TaxID=468196 RepID=A0ABR1AVT8_POLSC
MYQNPSDVLGQCHTSMMRNCAISSAKARFTPCLTLRPDSTDPRKRRLQVAESHE